MRRAFLPDTLVGRTILVVLVGLVISQIAGFAVFSINRLELTNRVGRGRAAERIMAAVQSFEATPTSDRPTVLRALDAPGFSIGWGSKPLVEKDDTAGEGAAMLATFQRNWHARELHVSMMQPEDLQNSNEPANGSGILKSMLAHAPHNLVRVAVRLEDGTWLNFLAPVGPAEPLWHPRFYMPLLIGFVVILLFSVFAVRYAARPLAVLAAAAQRLGRDVSTPPVPEIGPREVRSAARAFNEMQTRLRRFIEDRTQMIAAISHDLRTPITRLRLRAEFVDDDEQRDKMLADLDEMESMIAATLAFARDDVAREPRQRVDLAALLAELAGDFGHTYLGPDSLSVLAGPNGLKRAFANLLDNARAYAGEARVTLTEPDGGIAVTIDDDGPGIPAQELERVFAPFYRVEGSRNRETGGVGLGLSIARSAIRAHGGDIELENRQGGGLRVTVTLPGRPES